MNLHVLDVSLPAFEWANQQQLLDGSLSIFCAALHGD